MKKGKKLGIRIGLWFNPSVQMIFRLGEGCPGYCVFISSIRHRVLQDRWFADSYKASRREFAPSFDKVALETDHHVIFNLDATAGRRGGYHSMNEYGNIFWRIDILIGETTILIGLCAICGNCLVMFLLKNAGRVLEQMAQC